jgi:outer membrane receptor protein involved in Fe transport
MAHACRPTSRVAYFAFQQFYRTLIPYLIATLVLARLTYCQADTATVSGVITDQSGGVVVGAEVLVTNADTNIAWTGISNGSGIYLVTGLRPGRYRIHIAKEGFKGIDLTDLTLNVQDSVSRNFTLQIGSTSESISVEGNALQVNTQDATVSTVVDRQFAENLPMNGRSFQTLIELTPGVVVTAPTGNDGGQFSVNGQRPVSNYWMVDGVSANFGVQTLSPGNSSAGTLPSFSVLGGTNSLVSVDALQEFRIQTSTYAPEFGRTPGGQISIVTRSGTNQFHGTAFDYLRNDVFDANNWFNGENILNPTPLPKAQERQNDFGGTFSGPILKDRTFFFFSYEGLRLRLPQTALTTVPDASFTPGGTTNSRQNAMPALQPFLNAYPLPNPNSPEIFVACDPATDPSCPSSGQKPTGSAALNASYSNPATLDAYSLRVDQKLGDKLNLFGRYNYSPSRIAQRGGGSALSTVGSSNITTQTATVGVTWAISPTAANEFRFNYSRNNGESSALLDNFHGAIPPASLLLPTPFTTQNANFLFDIFGLAQTSPSLHAGLGAGNLMRQINITDNLSVQRGTHSLKFGVDYRRLSPIYRPAAYQQQVFFATVADAGAGNLNFGIVQSQVTSALLFHNLGVFAQDTWRITPRLTLTYGLRWDTDFAPSSGSGPSLLAVTGYDLNDLSKLALAPAGTPPFKTTYGNVAPRIGAAYQLSQSPDWQTVLRGGFGLFYDLATSQAGNADHLGLSYPFGAFSFLLGPPSGGSSTFPLSPSDATPPIINVATLAAGTSTLYAFDPKLKLPYTLQWSFALEQALGKQQSLSASYIGSVGRRLIQSADVQNPPGFPFPFTRLVGNGATSDYDALQLQFQRRLSQGLQALASYTWSHSIDDGSTGSYANASSTSVPGISPNSNRGPSDFDIRNTFSAGVTYEIPTPKINAFANAILRGWSTESFILARSATPEDIYYANTFPSTLIHGGSTSIRPDVVPGEPLYLYGPQYPGGKAFNPAAFAPPPVGGDGFPLRQGNLGRNTLRGFGATQWDFAVHRDFPIHESLKLQFRAEMFNVLNHPNFGPPAPAVDGANFGVATQMLGQGLTEPGAAGFNPLYQIGGPRSIQLALKLTF